MSVNTQKIRKRDGAATREKIMAEALILFARKGFDATSIKDISTAVGVADAALYRHFPSKDEIASAIFTRHYSALAHAIACIGERSGSFRETLHELTGLLCSLFDEQPEVFAFILISQHNYLRFVGHHENVVAELSAVMKRAHERGEIAIANADLAAAIALGAAVQPAVFHIYGRLAGKLAASQATIEKAIYSALGGADCE